VYVAWLGVLETVPWPTVEAVTVYWFWVKVAVTALFPVIDTVSGLLEPEASPLQPEKLHPAAGVAVSWTLEP
jgi:hypothetical protein